MGDLFKKLMIIGAAGLVVLAFATVVKAETLEIPPEVINQVKMNCSLLKSRLKQIQLRDALSRVNNGQIYESISLSVINPTNTRLFINNLKPIELLTISNDYEGKMAEFRQRYVVYEEQMSDLLNSSCTDRPEEFYLKLNKVRGLRQDLNSLTKKILDLINNYRLKFKEYFSENQSKAQ